MTDCHWCNEGARMREDGHHVVDGQVVACSRLSRPSEAAAEGGADHAAATEYAAFIRRTDRGGKLENLAVCYEALSDRLEQVRAAGRQHDGGADEMKVALCFAGGSLYLDTAGKSRLSIGDSDVAVDYDEDGTAYVSLDKTEIEFLRDKLNEYLPSGKAPTDGAEEKS